MAEFRARPNANEGETLSQSKLMASSPAVSEVQKSSFTKAFEAQLTSQARKFDWTKSEQYTYRGVDEHAVVTPVITNQGAPTESFYLHSGKSGGREMGFMMSFKPPMKLTLNDPDGRGLEISLTPEWIWQDGRETSFPTAPTARGGGTPTAKINWSCFLNCLKAWWSQTGGGWLSTYCKTKCTSCMKDASWGTCLICAGCIGGSVFYCWKHC